MSRTPRLSPRRRLAAAGLAAAALTVGTSQLPAFAAPATAPTTVPATAPATADQTVALPSAPGSNTVTYDGHAPFNNGSGNIAADDVTGACNPSDPNGSVLRDEHTVELTVPQQPDPAYDVLVRFQIDWSSPTPEAAADMRMDLYGPDGKLVASSDGSQFSEGVNVTSATPGVYDMVVCAFQTGPNGQDYTGSVTASLLQPPPSPQASLTNAPAYRQYEAPKGAADYAGEPSIGNNWKSGNTLFTADTDEYVVKFDDAAGTSSWELVNDDVADPSNKVSLDPIGYTDSETGRTFVSQLLFACSGAAYSDDDFATQATPSEGCGSGINGFDHQTFGGGAFPAGVTPLTSYPHAVYYCSQAIGLVAGGAECSRSDDGGATFGTPVDIFNGACNGLHGHVRVSPTDGAVYVPDNNCAGKQGITVSTDGGQTWTVHQVPDSVAGTSDPSVSVGKDGTVYFGYADGTGRAKVAVSRDHGATWSPSIDAGGPFGVRNSEFAEVIAGDGDRAAFAFLGTTTPGSTQADSFGKSADGTTYTGGEWHMYVATTYDRGATWHTEDATPNDPVQRGCIWNSGGSNPCRNLLDFNDITLDKTGHVMVGFADGCVGPDLATGSNCVQSDKVSDNGLTDHGAIIRQVSGPGLLAAYDGVNGSPTGGVNVPESPLAVGLPVAATLVAGGVLLYRRRRVDALA